VESVIRKVESRTLETVKKKRNLEPYARLFPGNLEQALAPTGCAQAAVAVDLADLIAPASEPRLGGVTDEIANLTPALREAAAILLTRSDSVVAAETAAAAAYGAELTTRRQWREQYRKTHGLLTVLYPSDRRKVESFFKAAKKVKKKGPPVVT